MHSSVAGRQVCDFVPTSTLGPTSTLVSPKPFREDGGGWRELGSGGGVTNRTPWLLCGSDHVTPGDIERFLSAALSPWIWGYNMAFVVTQQ